MADKVQYIMDRMAITFRQMEESQVFSTEEVRSIVKRRTDFEYSLRRMEMTVATYDDYLQYEFSLDKLLEIRTKKLSEKVQEKSVVSLLRGLKTASIRHIHYIFERGLRRFPDNINLWDRAIEFLARKQSNALLDELLGRAIALHPKNIHFWVKTAEHELYHNNNIQAARVLMQRSLRINDSQFSLWSAYFKLEIWNIQRALLRQQKLGISEEGMTEIIPGLMAPAMVVFRYARDAIIDGSSTSKDLSPLFLMHLETLSLSFDQLATDVNQELMNSLQKLSTLKQKEELLLHLLHFQLQQYLRREGGKITSLQQVLLGLIGQSFTLFESLVLSGGERGATSTQSIAFLSRWLLQVFRKAIVAAVRTISKGDTPNNNEQEDSESVDSDEGDDEEEDDNESDDHSTNSEASGEKADKRKTTTKTKKIKMTAIAKRLRMVLQSAYDQRSSLLGYCDVFNYSSPVMTQTTNLVETECSSKEGKKWKKDCIQLIVQLLDALSLSSDHTHFTVETGIQSEAIVQTAVFVKLLGFQNEKLLKNKCQNLLLMIGEQQVASADVLAHWQQRIDAVSSSSQKAAAHSGPCLQLAYELQLWSILSLNYLHFMKSNDANAELIGRLLQSLYQVLPRLAPWLIQPVSTFSSDSDGNPSVESFSLADPTLMAVVEASPGFEFMSYLTNQEHAKAMMGSNGTTVVLEQCIESIVCDMQIVSFSQREHWILHSLQASVPTEEDWIMLVDTKAIFQRWQTFVSSYEQLLARYRRHPHLFAQVDIDRIFHFIWQSVDTFLGHLHLDVSSLFRTRKLEQSLSEQQKIQLIEFVRGLVETSVQICPQEDGFLQKQIEMLRAMEKHTEANHLQFKRRRLI